jgi:hypothetical protein
MSRSTSTTLEPQRVGARPRHLTRAVLVVAAVLVLAALVAGGLALLRRPAGYARYVSAPQPDGSRFTFLYPAHLKTVAAGRGASPDVSVSATAYNQSLDPAPWDGVRRWLGMPVPAPGESVTVVVMPLQHLSGGQRRYSRRPVNPLELRHNEYLVDARTRSRLILMHSCPPAAPGQFEAHNQVIAPSLEVLPPGAPVPAP